MRCPPTPQFDVATSSPVVLLPGSRYWPVLLCPIAFVSTLRTQINWQSVINIWFQKYRVKYMISLAFTQRARATTTTIITTRMIGRAAME